jgi:hypothetical protein
LPQSKVLGLICKRKEKKTNLIEKLSFKNSRTNRRKPPICQFPTCQKFLENPISLACSFNLCREHFVLKNSIVKTETPIYQVYCHVCQKVHEFAQDSLKINEYMADVINENNHLNEQQKQIKSKLAELQQILSGQQNHSIKNGIVNYFEKIRNQVKLHRDELVQHIKERSDQILTIIKELEEAKLEMIAHSNQPPSKRMRLSEEESIDLTEYQECVRTPEITIQQSSELLVKINQNISEIKQRIEMCQNESELQFLGNQKIVFVPYSTVSFGCLKFIDQEKFQQKKTHMGHYVGELGRNKILQGFGVFTFTKPPFEGNKYEGEFFYNRLHGHGHYSYHNGDVYTGQIIQNEITGFGVWCSSNKAEKYMGEFWKGKKQGTGTYFFSNRDKYVGEWVDDKATGRGVMYYADGERFSGQFLNGQIV